MNHNDLVAFRMALFLAAFQKHLNNIRFFYMFMSDTDIELLIQDRSNIFRKGDKAVGEAT
ncbi:MAG TPA: hypothetical protein DCG57_19635 [Candidatus Riflebacteria bacterium]|nr:hypothetical protein [Candidatus Riflebacteria bacterium]